MAEHSIKNEAVDLERRQNVRTDESLERHSEHQIHNCHRYYVQLVLYSKDH